MSEQKQETKKHINDCMPGSITQFAFTNIGRHGTPEWELGSFRSEQDLEFAKSVTRQSLSLIIQILRDFSGTEQEKIDFLMNEKDVLLPQIHIKQ